MPLTHAAKLAAPSSGRKALTSVLNELVEMIVAGHWPEGQLLPPEETLLERFGVSRTTLRESLQHLVATGLVRARPQAGTVIQPRERWNLLDPVILAAALRHVTDRSFYDNLVDARILIEPEAAALAAQRGCGRAVPEGAAAKGLLGAIYRQLLRLLRFAVATRAYPSLACADRVLA